MTSRCRVLLVDDDAKILAEMGLFLRLEGHEVICARDGEDALRKVSSFQPNIVILDIKMPGIDGREVLRRMRARGDQVPVLMLTEVTGADAHIQALDEGADDYLEKVATPGELRARIQAVMRRARPEQPVGQTGRWLCCGKLRVDCQTHRAFLGKRAVKLPPREVRMLEHLMRHAGELVEHDALVKAVWGSDEIVGAGSVYVGIAKIRQVLGCIANQPCTIETVAGAGYHFTGTVEVLS